MSTLKVLQGTSRINLPVMCLERQIRTSPGRHFKTSSGRQIETSPRRSNRILRGCPESVRGGLPQEVLGTNICRLGQMFFKIIVLKNFVNFTGKHLRRELLLIKLQAFRTATLLKRENEFCELFKNTHFVEDL